MKAAIDEGSSVDLRMSSAVMLAAPAELPAMRRFSLPPPATVTLAVRPVRALARA